MAAEEKRGEETKARVVTAASFTTQAFQSELSGNLDFECPRFS